MSDKNRLSGGQKRSRVILSSKSNVSSPVVKRNPLQKEDQKKFDYNLQTRASFDSHDGENRTPENSSLGPQESHNDSSIILDSDEEPEKKDISSLSEEKLYVSAQDDSQHTDFTQHMSEDESNSEDLYLSTEDESFACPNNKTYCSDVSRLEIVEENDESQCNDVVETKNSTNGRSTDKEDEVMSEDGDLSDNYLSDDEKEDSRIYRPDCSRRTYSTDEEKEDELSDLSISPIPPDTDSTNIQSAFHHSVVDDSHHDQSLSIEQHDESENSKSHNGSESESHHGGWVDENEDKHDDSRYGALNQTFDIQDSLENSDQPPEDDISREMECESTAPDSSPHLRSTFNYENDGIREHSRKSAMFELSSRQANDSDTVNDNNTSTNEKEISIVVLDSDDDDSQQDCASPTNSVEIQDNSAGIDVSVIQLSSDDGDDENDSSEDHHVSDSEHSHHSTSLRNDSTTPIPKPIKKETPPGRSSKSPEQFEDADQLQRELFLMKDTLAKVGAHLPDNGTKLILAIAKKQEKLEEIRSRNIVHEKKWDNETGGSASTGVKISNGVLRKLMDQLSTKPLTSDITETPESLRQPLLDHQKSGLTWLLWRENQECPGGILADDMGLGKTVAMISLICAQKEARQKMSEEESKANKQKIKDMAHNLGLRPSFSTLIVLPTGLCGQWGKEIEDKVHYGDLSVIMYNGNKNQRNYSAKQLAAANIVITTYGIVKSELVCREKDPDGLKRRKNMHIDESAPLCQVLWDRIILDEAHTIKNRKTDQAKACYALYGIHRWALTGTPLHNNLWDMYSLIKFIQMSPFSMEDYWASNMGTNSKMSTQRLNALVDVIILRRTKAVLEMGLSKRNDMEHILEMTEMEKEVYKVMAQASRLTVEKFLNRPRGEAAVIASDACEEENYQAENVPERKPFIGHNSATMHTVLVALLRMRQGAVHFSLTRQGIDETAFEGLTGVHMDMFELESANRTINEWLSEREEKIEAKELFLPTTPSTKVSRILCDIEAMISSGEKGVVISQWVTVLDMFKRHLHKRGIQTVSIAGNIPAKERDVNLAKFRDSEGPQIMLLSLTAGGVGLNLVSANHLFMVDLHWNPQLEEQAFCRIYRYGQTKEVFINRYVMSGTIEQRVLELQQKKKVLAESVLTGKAQKGALSMADLRYLFGLDEDRKDD